MRGVGGASTARRLAPHRVCPNVAPILQKAIVRLFPAVLCTSPFLAHPSSKARRMDRVQLFKFISKMGSKKKTSIKIAVGTGYIKVSVPVLQFHPSIQTMRNLARECGCTVRIRNYNPVSDCRIKYPPGDEALNAFNSVFGSD